ncbi:MAG: hypothetical protein RI924_734 [Bacteroidota bacterium]|jgi:hypothetical protein
MIWVYRICLLLNALLLLYASINIKVSGTYNRAIILCIIILILFMAAAFILKNNLNQLNSAVILLVLPLLPVLLFLLFLVIMFIVKPDFK